MVRSVNFSNDTFSNLEDLIAYSCAGKKNQLSKYISGLINKEHKLVKPPRHDTDQNGIQQQSEQEESGPAKEYFRGELQGFGEQNDYSTIAD